MNKNGYTLIEISAVIIILGITASLAMTKYDDYMRRIKSQEARQILISLFGAQIERRRVLGTYFAGTQAQINAAPNPLNVTFTQPLRNFKDLTAEPGTVLCGFSTVGRIEANDNSYALHITNQGNIICTTLANACGSVICTRIQ